MENVYETQIDKLGRIELKKELLEKLGISYKSALEMRLTSNAIIFVPYEPQCAICGEKIHNLKIGDTSLCEFCIQAIANDELANSWNTKFIQHVRMVDEFGKISLPIEYRRQLNLAEGDDVTVSFEAGEIYVNPTAKIKCFTCGSEENLYKAGNYYFCKECMNAIHAISKTKE